MSLVTFVKEARETRDSILKKVAPDLMKGVLPSNCFVIDNLTYREGNLKYPKNETILKIKSGDIIARYHKSIDKWVLSKGVSPDILPSIASKETISNEQFKYMSIRAQYKKYCNDGFSVPNTYRHIDWDNPYESNVDEKTFFEDDMSAQLKRQASKAHRQLSSTIKSILSQHETPIDVGEGEMYIRTKGTFATENVQDNTSKTSTEDILALMYKDIHRIPELEDDFETKQQHSQTINEAPSISKPFSDEAR